MTGEFRRVSLLVVAVGVIATAFAIHRQYRKALEYGVSAPLNAINTACLVYAQTYPKFGFPRELSQLGLDLRKPLGPDNSGLIDSVLASGVKGGYVYRYQPGSQDKSGRTTTYTRICNGQEELLLRSNPRHSLYRCESHTRSRRPDINEFHSFPRQKPSRAHG